MKKQCWLSVVITILFLSFSLFAQEQAEPAKGSFAFGGVTGGHPWVGATVKYWLTDKMALDGSFGFAGDLDLQANFTVNKKYFDFPKGDMQVVLGGGIWMDFPVDFDLGIQGVGGVEWFLPQAPWGVFAQYCPAFNFFFANGNTWVFEPFFFSVGARYYF